MSDVVYVVRDASGEYLRADGSRTPASDEAQEFDGLVQAREACARASDRVLERETE